MGYINLEKISENIKKGSKLVLQKGAPVLLAGTIAFTSLTMPAQAASITIKENTSVTYEDEAYVNSSSTTSSYFSDKQEREVRTVLTAIDNKFQSLYNKLANGAKDYSTNDVLVFYTASVEEIADYVEEENESLSNYYQRSFINRYLNSKKAEAKCILANVCNLSAKDIDDFIKNNRCYYVSTSGMTTNISYIASYPVKNGSTDYTRMTMHAYDESKLTSDKALIAIPTIEAVYKNYSSTPTFYESYTGVIVPATALEKYNAIVKEVALKYDLVDEAVKQGQYTVNYNQAARDAYMMSLGDTNLINRTISAEYNDNNDALLAAQQYMRYRQGKVMKAVYDKNSYRCNYKDYEAYKADFYALRTQEAKQGKDTVAFYNVYPNPYQENVYTTQVAKDKGYVTTYKLTNIAKNPTHDTVTPTPTPEPTPSGSYYIDENGNKVYIGEPTPTPTPEPTPVEPEKHSYYYIDENGNKIYVDESEINFQKKLK